MNAPLIWIGFPLAAAILLWFLRSRGLIIVVSAAVVCLLLALLAWLLPIGNLIRLGPLTTEITPIFSILGRRFILQDTDRTLMIFLYTFGAVWFFGESVIRKNTSFVPLGLAILALSISALAVEPFLYAALIIEIIVLISIPMLIPPGTKVGQGLLRYLIFQTLAMALILLAGWAAGGVEANPNDTRLTSQALIFLGLGFAFWLAVFPFHTWIPLIVSEAFPYHAGFLLAFLPQVILLFVLDFLNGFAWLRQFPNLPNVLRFLGLIMVFTGGVWAAFQSNLTRLFGFAVVVEIGFSLLALSLWTPSGYEIFMAMFLPRIIALAVWSLAMSFLGEGALDIQNIAGMLRKKPVESIAILAACFTISGLPLLAIFPLRQVLFENLAQQSVQAVVWALIGNTGFMLASIRIMIVMLSTKEVKWQRLEDWRPVALLVIGILFLFLIGIMPEWFMSAMKNMLDAYGNLV